MFKGLITHGGPSEEAGRFDDPLRPAIAHVYARGGPMSQIQGEVRVGSKPAFLGGRADSDLSCDHAARSHRDLGRSSSCSNFSRLESGSR